MGVRDRQRAYQERQAQEAERRRVAQLELQLDMTGKTFSKRVRELEDQLDAVKEDGASRGR